MSGLFVLFRWRLRMAVNGVVRRAEGRPSGLLPLVGLAIFGGWIAQQLHTVLSMLIRFGDAGQLAAQRIIASILLGLLVIEAIFAVNAAIAHLFQARDLPLLLSLPIPESTVYGAKLFDALIRGNPFVPLTAVVIVFATAAVHAGTWLLVPLRLAVVFVVLLLPLAVGTIAALAAATWLPSRRARDIFLGLGSLAAAAVIMGINLAGVRVRDEQWRDQFLRESADAPVAAVNARLPHQALARMLLSRPGDPSVIADLAPTLAMAVVAAGAGAGACRKLYLRGRSRFLTAPSAPPPGRTRRGFLGPRARHGPARAVAAIDATRFLREPVLWSMLLFPLLVIVGVLPAVRTVREQMTPDHVESAVRALAIGVSGVIAALSAGTLALSAVGRERPWWVIASSGISPERYLAGKLLSHGAIAAVYSVAGAAAILSIGRIGPRGWITGLAWAFVLGQAEVVVGLAIGARNPDFEAASPRRAVRPVAGMFGSYLMLGIAALVAFVSDLPGLLRGVDLPIVVPTLAPATAVAILGAVGWLSWTRATRAVADLIRPRNAGKKRRRGRNASTTGRGRTGAA